MGLDVASPVQVLFSVDMRMKRKIVVTCVNVFRWVGLAYKLELGSFRG
jgi:hypothetical protein